MNILPPKLTWEPKVTEENRKNDETTHQDLPKNTLGQKSDRMGGKPSSQILETRTIPAPQKKVILPPPEFAPTEETSKNSKRGQKPTPELKNFEAPPPGPNNKLTKKPPPHQRDKEAEETSNQTKKNAFQVLKWPPKNQYTPKTTNKTKPTKPRTKSKTKQPEQPEEKNNQTKITSILKPKTSKSNESETS